jgi:hypothetical protein
MPELDDDKKADPYKDADLSQLIDLRYSRVPDMRDDIDKIAKAVETGSTEDVRQIVNAPDAIEDKRRFALLAASVAMRANKPDMLRDILREHRTGLQTARAWGRKVDVMLRDGPAFKFSSDSNWKMRAQDALFVIGGTYESTEALQVLKEEGFSPNLNRDQAYRLFGDWRDNTISPEIISDHDARLRKTLDGMYYPAIMETIGKAASPACDAQAVKDIVARSDLEQWQAAFPRQLDALGCNLARSENPRLLPDTIDALPLMPEGRQLVLWGGLAEALGSPNRDPQKIDDILTCATPDQWDAASDRQLSQLGDSLARSESPHLLLEKLDLLPLSQRSKTVMMYSVLSQENKKEKPDQELIRVLHVRIAPENGLTPGYTAPVDRPENLSPIYGSVAQVQAAPWSPGDDKGEQYNPFIARLSPGHDKEKRYNPFAPGVDEKAKPSFFRAPDALIAFTWMLLDVLGKPSEDKAHERLHDAIINDRPKAALQAISGGKISRQLDDIVEIDGFKGSLVAYCAARGKTKTLRTLLAAGAMADNPLDPVPAVMLAVDNRQKDEFRVLLTGGAKITTELRSAIGTKAPSFVDILDAEAASRGIDIAEWQKLRVVAPASPLATGKTAGAKQSFAQLRFTEDPLSGPEEPAPRSARAAQPPPSA